MQTVEDLVRVKEMQLEINSSEKNRPNFRSAKYDLQKLKNMEEEYWKQKVGMKWFIEGEKNTKFFHTYVKGRRRKLSLQKIENDQGKVLEDQQKIREEAVRVF